MRLTGFLLRRHGEESYAPKFLEIQYKSDVMGLLPKLGIVGAVRPLRRRPTLLNLKDITKRTPP